MSATTTDLRARLKDAFRWNEADAADPSGWWRDPVLLGDLAEALGALHGPDAATVVAGVPSRGFLLGSLVAQRLGVGFVEIRKDRKGERHGKGVLRRSTPPDYAQRDLTLSLRAGLLGARDRVLFVDDWIATGAQATAALRLVEDAGAGWAGAAIVVDATEAAVRRALSVRALLSIREL